MKASQIYAEIANTGKNEERFLANVIMTHHSQAARKLRGLKKLIDAGHECRTGQFGIDTLIIDGIRYGWEILEYPNLIINQKRHGNGISKALALEIAKGLNTGN